MSVWQTIETAPRDGTIFLCWVSAIDRGERDDGSYVEVDVSQCDFCQWQDACDDRDGDFENCGGKFADVIDITHWMPLPEEPK